jgi:hypothetical protein
VYEIDDWLNVSVEYTDAQAAMELTLIFEYGLPPQVQLIVATSPTLCTARFCGNDRVTVGPACVFGDVQRRATGSQA